MHFDLNDEQVQIEASLDNLLSKSRPLSTLVQQVEGLEFDKSLYANLAELGLIGILAPEDVGGLEMDLLTLAVISERLGYHAAPAPIVENALCAWLLAQTHPEVAADIITGNIIAGLSIAPEVNGQDALIKNIIWPDACDIVLARIDNNAFGLFKLDGSGVNRQEKASLDLSRPIADYEVQLKLADTIDVSSDKADRACDALKILYALDAYGAGTRSAEMTIEYAKEREQFDQKIGSFQGLKFQLTDMMCEQMPSRFLGWIAAHKWDLEDDDSKRLAALAKAHLTDVAVRSGRRSVECHGGIGYTWDYPLHLFLKRAMFDRAINGLPNEHRAEIAQIYAWNS